MGINKNKIPHYFLTYSTLVLGTYFCYDVVMFLSFFEIKSFCIHIEHTLCFFI
jgi:hypothetical protein